MNIPQSDILSTSRLGKIFSNTVATYKYFWFVSIMQIHAKEDCQVMESLPGYHVSPGHALIIPKRHVASYFDLTNHERETMNVMLQYVRQKVEERYHPDGFNVGINIGEAAGQSVFHCHMHLIPRYKGDVPNQKGGVRGVIPSKQKY